MALSVWCRYHRQFQHQCTPKKQRQISKWIYPRWHRRSCVIEIVKRLWMPSYLVEAFHSISPKQSCCSIGINCGFIPYLKCWETCGTVQGQCRRDQVKNTSCAKNQRCSVVEGTQVPELQELRSDGILRDKYVQQSAKGEAGAGTSLQAVEGELEGIFNEGRNRSGWLRILVFTKRIENRQK